MANYTDAEIRGYIREVVREAKSSARVDTGYLKRSIRGDLIGRNRSAEFRQVVYGVYNRNSKLVEIAKKIMPKDISWKVILEDEDGNETTVTAKTRTGRTISRSSISSASSGTNKIKSLLALLRLGKKKDDTAETD